MLATNNSQPPRVLITGAAQGIGAAIATEIARLPSQIVLLDKNISGVANTSKRIEAAHNKVRFFACDLTDIESIHRISQTVIQEWGGVDILINNAGISHDLADTTEIKMREAQQVFAVNYFAPLALVQDFLPGMRERQYGMIINITSTANILGYEGLSVYSSSKAALSSLTDTIALENENFGIKAIDIAPGRTNTPLQIKVRGTEVAAGSQDPQVVAEVVAKVITGEIGVDSGDEVRIQDGKHIVEKELFSNS